MLNSDPLELVPMEGDFSKNKPINTNLDKLYFTAGYAELSESGEDTDAGYKYEQEFGFGFPTNDDRKKILQRYRFLKLIRIHLCNGKTIELGRNDYRQNKPMVGTFNTDKNFTELNFKISTIFPYEAK
ncbi:hypothetical protein [Chryseobacterium sp. FH1]|uniref:hypothetical protein n=1 Tax=Chryseobacterium sp. FH1 TaxID=1233951 RepID=UPI001040D670|nr:hypothetical protein [Chryseobacterium sp. FH1]